MLKGLSSHNDRLHNTLHSPQKCQQENAKKKREKKEEEGEEEIVITMPNS